MMKMLGSWTVDMSIMWPASRNGCQRRTLAPFVRRLPWLHEIPIPSGRSQPLVASGASIEFIRSSGLEWIVAPLLWEDTSVKANARDGTTSDCYGSCQHEYEGTHSLYRFYLSLEARLSSPVRFIHVKLSSKTFESSREFRRCMQIKDGLVWPR